MKKILLVLAVAAIGMVSCKKEEAAQPAPVENTAVAGVKGDLSSMD